MQNSTHDSKDIYSLLINSTFLLIVECKSRSFYHGKFKIKDETIM